MPLLSELSQRYRDERPFADITVVFGHLLVRNSMVMVETLLHGGAQVVLSRAHPSPAEADVHQALSALAIDVHPVRTAVALSDIYLDVGAVLAKARLPRLAAEVTRTGVLHYRRLDVPVVSADDARSKLIEGFFGTGDGFLRAWRQLRPGADLAGKRILQFGYGKIGRGLAHRCRAAGIQQTIVDSSSAARARATADGFQVLKALPNGDLEAALAAAEVVIAVTGVPGAVGALVPADWLRQSGALVNLGAEDEFGPAFGDEEILGGKSMPLNFHLARPTQNRYVDPPLAAHLLALEALIRQPNTFGPGVHPLPAELDRWVVTRWRHHHPDEDLTGIADDLKLA